MGQTHRQDRAEGYEGVGLSKLRGWILSARRRLTDFDHV